MLDWNVAVYCLNEEARLRACLDSVAVSLAGCRALITVILNGSRDGSLAVAQRAARDGLPIEIFRIKAGDKANAINQFLHHLRVPAAAVGGVDAYAYVGPASFPALAARLHSDPHAMAVTGICLNGRTMRLATEETLTVGGRLHGQLHGLRGDFVDRMVAAGLRLPLGTYWGDGLLGSMAAHNLDAMGEPWDNTRVVGVAEATYTIPELSPLRIEDLRRHFRRRVRQMQGRLQTTAIKDVIYREGFAGLPEDAGDMVRQFLRTNPPPAMRGVDRLFQRMALREVRQPARPDPASLQPQRMGTEART